MFQKHVLHKLIQSALEEDVGAGDITTSSVLTGEETGVARAVAKSDIVVAGMDVFKEVFLFVVKGMRFADCCEDGRLVMRGESLAEVSGSLGKILTAERVALNFFQRMCGIATLTKQYVDAVRGTRAKILDTRKTVPGLRCLDKYSVKVGGGCNHRFGLYDGVLIKDNNITAAGGISRALERVRRRILHTHKVDVEVKNL